MWDTSGLSSDQGLNGNVCMPDRERERRGGRVCVSEVSLKTSKHSTWWQWVPEHRHPVRLALLFIPPTFPPEAACTSPEQYGGEWGGLAEAYTQAFFSFSSPSNESQIPWNLFMLWAIDWLIYFTCHLQFIISATTVEGHIAALAAFIKWCADVDAGGALQPGCTYL